MNTTGCSVTPAFSRKTAIHSLDPPSSKYNVVPVSLRVKTFLHNLHGTSFIQLTKDVMEQTSIYTHFCARFQSGVPTILVSAKCGPTGFGFRNVTLCHSLLPILSDGTNPAQQG